MEIFFHKHLFNIKISNFPLEVHILKAMIVYDEVLVLLIL